MRNVEDLVQIASLGFRGEALSSLSAVSQGGLITKTPESLTGVRYCIEGGTEKELEEIGAPSGTTFLVHHLFYNTPARAKFLKSATAEGNSVSTVVEQLALSHPEISFKYIQNGQNKLYTSGNGNLKEIVYQIYGRDLTRELIAVEAETPLMKISGFIGNPSVARGNRNFENYFVNGRYVKSRTMTAALEEAYAAEQKAEAARAQREKATQEADVIVKTGIDKRRRELEAEAEAEQIRRRAKGEADAILAKMQAEAQGAQEILVKQADGLRQIVAAAGGDADHAVRLMLADKMEELMRIQVDAVKGIKIDKVTVWDGGEQKDGKTATAGFVSGLMKSIPPMNEMFDMAGMELPRFLGKNKEEPAAPPAPAEESGAPAEES